MALFSRNKSDDTNTKETEKKTKPVSEKRTAAAKETVAATRARDLARVLRNPRITEKASDLQGKSVYTFDLADGVSKREVIEAVRAVYNVSPRKVAVITVRAKTRRSARTGQTGRTRSGRKAYVYLNAGETIAIH